LTTDSSRLIASGYISRFEKCDARLILDFSEPESLPDIDKSKSDFQSVHRMLVRTMAPESNNRQIKVIIEELTLVHFNNVPIRTAKPMKTGYRHRSARPNPTKVII